MSDADRIDKLEAELQAAQERGNRLKAQLTGKLAGERPLTSLGLRRGNTRGQAPSQSAARTPATPLGRAAPPSSSPSSSPSVAVVSFSVIGTPKKLAQRSLSGSPCGTPTGTLARSRNASAANSRRSSRSGGLPLPSSFPNEVAKRLESVTASVGQSGSASISTIISAACK